jgi:sugar transferase EpsL
MYRLRDLILVLIAAPLWLPLMAIVALLVALRLGSPILFRQPRIGLRGRSFVLYKFRTMRDEVGPDARPLPDSERLTSFGRMLRSTSLDELPSLWNVIRGEMSLVGPRPLLPEYLALYNSRQLRRHEVRPGITGWAQVNGRNAVGWQERLEMDVWYVENRSFLLDCRILLRTFIQVFRRAGISQPGHATMEPFRGNDG